MGSPFGDTYQDIISVGNLADAWKEFLRGKRDRKDVTEFEVNLMDHILRLHRELRDKTYRHGPYQRFHITDPKPRIIHKATVRDRLLHHAIHRQLYPFFDRTFISGSYSCRDGRGIHKALDQFRVSFLKASRNNTRTAWVLKCDIRKFFASIHHGTLLAILSSHIPDKEIVDLLNEVISSFGSTPETGLPLGNLTSQLFANVYMNRLDQFVKHKLKVKHYVRYADDFVFVSRDYAYLKSLVPRIGDFLGGELGLKLHPDKVFIKSIASGVDFLGWVHFPDYRVLRTVTKKRMFRRIAETGGKKETVSSYCGMLPHGNTHKLLARILKLAQK